MVPTGRCYECFRPQVVCFCASIPKIDNQTDVLILQHRREQFHPFNTARIVHKALSNSRLVSDYTSNLAQRLQLKPRAGLLYPCPSARLISEVASEQAIEQLVVLDGTWPHANALLRNIPALKSLPRYRLAPTEPSRYRIRREPSATSLSTVEAVVAALRILEPETDGFDQLLRAFDRMVENQLTHTGSATTGRYRERRNRTFKNIPRVLLGDLANIVVAYGESAVGVRGCKQIAGPPISWVAQRLGTGETFSCLMIPSCPFDDVFLGHLALTKADFAVAVSLEEARLRWSKFQRAGDVVTVLRPRTARLFSYLAEGRDSCLALKSVDLEAPDRPTLDADFPTTEFPAAMMCRDSRAGRRLAESIGLVRYLNALANARLRDRVRTGPSHEAPQFTRS
jgi:DTW domain-containing protein YfiP